MSVYKVESTLPGRLLSVLRRGIEAGSGESLLARLERHLTSTKAKWWWTERMGRR